MKRKTKKQTQQQIRLALLALGVVVIMTHLVGSPPASQSGALVQPVPRTHIELRGSSSSLQEMPKNVLRRLNPFDSSILPSSADPPPDLERIAKRLQGRLERGFGVNPKLSVLVDALSQRRELLKRSVAVTLASAHDGDVLGTWQASTAVYPLWIRGSFTPFEARFSLDAERFAGDLLEQEFMDLPPPEPATLLEVREENGVSRAVIEGVAKAGHILDRQGLAEAVYAALLQGDTGALTFPVEHVPATIINRSGLDLGPLEFIAQGASNFAGSGNGRKSNVRKGLRERMNNVLVPPGGTFSFNTALGKLSYATGWEDALGIFNGRDLRPVLGGGLCQVATTMYRAAINAGFPIVERAPHSLYVVYYEKGGVGIDATIFPGRRDFRFTNDTQSPLLVQAYTEGDDAFVNLFGESGGKSVRLHGPYLASNAPDFRIGQRTLKNNDIAWTQEITHADGSRTENILYSRYNSIPTKKLAKEYPVPSVLGSSPAHAAAKESQE